VSSWDSFRIRGAKRRRNAFKCGRQEQIIPRLISKILARGESVMAVWKRGKGGEGGRGYVLEG
jgi:hypothetical protein